ncbi:fungal-specific transcription factor domain-containing protein [Trametes maxima]|nr:fungal-specific transcription factor domain-containing protein [Trametes maxima]
MSTTRPNSQGSWYPPIISLGGDDSEAVVPPQPIQRAPAAEPTASSSSRSDPSDLGSRTNLRKVERACDYCRKRKAKCDGPERKDHICSACEAGSRTCTYLEESKPRGPSKAYIDALEERVAKAERLLRQLRPELDLTAELGPPLNNGGWSGGANSRRKNAKSSANLAPESCSASPVPFSSEPDRSSRGKQRTNSRKRRRESSVSATLPDVVPMLYRLPPGASSDSDDAAVTHSEDTRLTFRGLESSMLSSPNDNQLRFQGASSSLSLISSTVELIQHDLAELHLSGSERGTPPSTRSSPPVLLPRRSDLYQLLPWEKRFERAYESPTVPDCILEAFPPDDLAEDLIRLYFTHEHITFPLLHRPTFERQCREELYRRDVWFASVCMCVFALGSRWTKDPRVRLDAPTSGQPEDFGGEARTPIPGWKYASVAITVTCPLTEAQSGLLIPPELCEIQLLVLLSQYLRGTVAQDTAWHWLSVGVMKAQDMGLHRKQTYGRRRTVEQELWKRVYWHLVVLDRFGSMLLGKPYFAREEDLDLEMPIEVDDEYWLNDDPEKAFRQPEGKPSAVSAFVSLIKLSHIVSCAMRTLYSARKPEGVFARAEGTDREDTVERLNGYLLHWLDGLPAHLRWRPDMDDTPFAHQAATLLEAYYIVQVLIQKPLLLPPRRLLRLNPTSERGQTCAKALAICVSASRASARVVDAHLRHRSGDIITALHVLFSAVGMLIVQFWDLTRRWGQCGETVTTAGRVPIPQRLNEILREIDWHVVRLRDLAPEWDLARIML